MNSTALICVKSILSLMKNTVENTTKLNVMNVMLVWNTLYGNGMSTCLFVGYELKVFLASFV
jgi:hypothetical protein